MISLKRILPLLLMLGLFASASADKLDRLERKIVEGDLKKAEKLYRIMLHKRAEPEEISKGLRIITRNNLSGAEPTLEVLAGRRESYYAVPLLEACLAIEQYRFINVILETEHPDARLSKLLEILAEQDNRSLQLHLAEIYTAKPNQRENVHQILNQQAPKSGVIEAYILKNGSSVDYESLQSNLQANAEPEILTIIAFELTDEPVTDNLVERFFGLQYSFNPESPYVELLKLLSSDHARINDLVLSSFALYPPDKQLLAIWQYRISLKTIQMPILVDHLSRWDNDYAASLLITIADSLQDDTGLKAFQAYLHSSVQSRHVNALRYVCNPYSHFYPVARQFLQDVGDGADEVIALHDLLDLFGSSTAEERLCLAGDVFQFLEDAEIDTLYLQLACSPSDIQDHQNPEVKHLRHFAARQVVSRGLTDDECMLSFFLGERDRLYECAVDYFSETRNLEIDNYGVLENLSLDKLADFLSFCHNIEVSSITDQLIGWYAKKPHLNGQLNHWLRHYDLPALRGLFSGFPKDSPAFRLPYLNLVAEHRSSDALEELRRYQRSTNNEIHLRALQLIYWHPMAEISDFTRDFNHSSKVVQYAAIQGLKRFSVGEIASHLITQLHRDDPNIRFVTQELISDLIQSERTDSTSRAILYGVRGSFRLENGELDAAIIDIQAAIDHDSTVEDYANQKTECLRRISERELQAYWEEQGTDYLKEFRITDSQRQNREYTYPDTTESEHYYINHSLTVDGLRYTLLIAYYVYDTYDLPQDLTHDFHESIVIELATENCTKDTLLVTPGSIEIEGERITDEVIEVSRLYNKSRRRSPPNHLLWPGEASRFFLRIPASYLDEDSLLTLRFHTQHGNPAQCAPYRVSVPRRKIAQFESDEHLKGVYEEVEE